MSVVGSPAYHIRFYMRHPLTPRRETLVAVFFTASVLRCPTSGT